MSSSNIPEHFEVRNFKTIPFCQYTNVYQKISKQFKPENFGSSNFRYAVDSYPCDHREGDWLSLQSTCNWDSQRTFTIAQLSHTVNRSRRTLRVGGVAQLNKILFFCDSHNGDRIVILTANLRTVKLFLFQSEILNH